MALTQAILGMRLRKARESCGLTQGKAAAALGLARVSLLQIEQGKRAVTTLEVVRFSRLYHQDITRLAAEDEVDEEEDAVLALCRVLPQLADQPEVRQQIYYYLELFEEGVELARLLGIRPPSAPPTYDLPDLTNYAEAARQGEFVALEERRRLNLGSRPIADVALLLTSQGIWAAAAGLSPEFSGLFLHSRSIGMAVLVNGNHPPGRQRFSFGHEYAHALFDRALHPLTMTGKHNSGDFIEKRANAFAAALLLPGDGVCELLQQRNKGGQSRETHWLWDVATGSGEQFEKRNEPGSQALGYQDVACIAHTFMVSYDAAVYRLSDLKLISKQEQGELLALAGSGREFMKLLDLQDPDEPQENLQPGLARQSTLIRQIGLLAVEAYRQEAISGGRFLEVCEKLKIRDAEKLLQLAGTSGQ